MQKLKSELPGLYGTVKTMVIGKYAQMALNRIRANTEEEEEEV